MADNPYAEFQSKADPYAEFRSGDAAPPPPTTKPRDNLSDAGNALMGVAQGVPEAIAGGLTGMADAVAHPVDFFNSQSRHMADLRSQGSKDFQSGNYADGLQHKLGGAIPMIGPWASDAMDTMFSPKSSPNEYGKALGSILAPGASRLLPATGRGLQKTAEPIIGNALGVRHIDRAFAKTPERAALDETSGLTPGAVGESARVRLKVLKPQLDSIYNNATQKASVAPAKGIIDANISDALAGNSRRDTGSVPQLRQMLEQLTEPNIPEFTGDIVPRPGVQPGLPTIADLQDPATILRLKRRFGKDYTAWNPLHPNPEVGVARDAYRALDNELDKAAPEGAQLNQRISSLIPIAQHAENTALKASGSQRALGRLAKPTGALVAPSAGFMAGGVPGAIAGLVLPEMLSSPTAQIAAARGINGAGKAIQSPFVTRPVQVSPFIKKRDEQK